MSKNPILRESLEIFFNEGHGFAVYFYLLIILAPIEFFSLYLPSLDAQMWSGSASLFKVCAVTALLLIVYFSMRVANQEFAPWRFQPVKRWAREQGQPIASLAGGQLGFLALHIAISMALCLPLLLWAAAIARTSAGRIAGSLLLIVFYAMSYGVWGLASLVFWERRGETRQVFIRSFFFGIFIISALLYLPLNPIAFLLAFLGQQELAPLGILGRKWPAPAVHFGFHFLLIAIGVALYMTALKREVRQ
jgi:hypothetical protein